MAVDIGPKIGIDGEAEFRKQINQLTQQIKTFGSEMKAVTSAYDSNEKSVESLTQQNEILNRSIDAQEKKLAELKKGLAAASQEFGENDQKTLKWAQAVNNATTDLNKMKSQVKQNEAAMDGLESGVKDAADAMGNAGKEAGTFGDTLKGVFAGTLITDGIKAIGQGLKQAMEDSKEYRKVMGSLEISSQQAGYSAEQTKGTYSELYGVLADNQTAATTTANLQALGLEQEKLNALVDGTIGAWAKYGDSIPIDGLAEAINETVKAGTVTGTFADVLNWAGTSEDDFNAKLAAAGSETERVNLVLQELANQGLMEAGNAWQQNNKSLVDANQATADYEAKVAALGAAVEPVFTAIQTVINSVLGVLVQLAQNIDFEGIASKITTIGDTVGLLFAGLISGNEMTSQSFSELTEGLDLAVADMIAGLQESLPQFVEQGGQVVTGFIDGLFAMLPDLLGAGAELVGGLIDTWISNLPQIIETGVEILISLVEGIQSMLPEVMSTALEIVTSLVQSLVENLPQIIDTGFRMLGELVAGIIKGIPDLIAAIPQITSAFADEMGRYDWAGIGKNILAGLANGIIGFVGTVVDAAREAAGKIASAFKDFFDINSPSGLTEEYAKYLMQGFARMNRYENVAVKAARKSAKHIAEAFPESISVPVQANGAAAAYDRLAERMNNLQIVLDDGTLVGKLSPKIDVAIGGYAKLQGRYAT